MASSEMIGVLLFLGLLAFAESYGSLLSRLTDVRAARSGRVAWKRFLTVTGGVELYQQCTERRKCT
jgi:hypothetical protein